MRNMNIRNIFHACPFGSCKHSFHNPSRLYFSISRNTWIYNHEIVAEDCRRLFFTFIYLKGIFCVVTAAGSNISVGLLFRGGESFSLRLCIWHFTNKIFFFPLMPPEHEYVLCKDYWNTYWKKQSLVEAKNFCQIS